MTEPVTASSADITVAAVQFASAQAWADDDAVTDNTARVADAYLAVADETDITVFPELALTGYIPLKGYDQRRKRVLAEVAAQSVEAALPDLATHTKGRRSLMVVGFMEPALMRGEFFNSVAVIQDGSVLGVYRKVHLPVEENHYFTPGDGVFVCDTRIGRIGVTICYDLLFPELARHAALLGTEVLVVPSNWLGIGNLERLGEVLPAARALEGQCHVVFVNGVGDLEVRGRNWSLYGKSRIISALGDVIAVAGSEVETLIGALPGAHLDAASDIFPVLRDRRPDLYGHLVQPQADFAALRDEM